MYRQRSRHGKRITPLGVCHKLFHSPVPTIPDKLNHERDIFSLFFNNLDHSGTDNGRHKFWRRAFRHSTSNSHYAYQECHSYRLHILLCCHFSYALYLLETSPVAGIYHFGHRWPAGRAFWHLAALPFGSALFAYGFRRSYRTFSILAMDDAKAAQKGKPYPAMVRISLRFSFRIYDRNSGHGWSPSCVLRLYAPLEQGKHDWKHCRWMRNSTYNGCLWAMA